MEPRITQENFHAIWDSILIKATDKYDTPPEVIHVSNSTISTLGNFSASTGKGKSKKTFNVCAIVASALTGRKILNYEANFPEGKQKVLYFDTEQSSYHCHKVLERINKFSIYKNIKIYILTSSHVTALNITVCCICSKWTDVRSSNLLWPSGQMSAW